MLYLFQGDKKETDQLWKKLTTKESACPLPIEEYFHLIQLYIGSLIYYPMMLERQMSKLGEDAKAEKAEEYAEVHFTLISPIMLILILLDGFYFLVKTNSMSSKLLERLSI